MQRTFKLTSAALAVLACQACGGGASEPVADGGPDADATDADAMVASPVDCSAAEELPAQISEDLTVGPGCVIMGQTRVQAEATLTLMPGTTVAVKAGGYLRTSPFADGGTVKALGTADDPITFTSAADSPLAGDWGCLFLAERGDQTELEHVIVEYAGAACGASGNGYETALVVQNAVRKLTDVTVRHSAGHGMILLRDAAVREFADNRFEDNALPSIQVNQNQVVSLGGGNVFADADDYIEIDTKFSASRDGVWAKQAVPYRINGHMQIGSSGNEVSIEPGTVIQLDNESLEIFMANLIAVGTAEEPIVFTSAQASPAAGDWGCIYFNAGMGTPRLEHVLIEYAGGGQGCTGASYPVALIVPGGATVTDNEFKDSAGYAIRTADACSDELCTNTFTNVAEDNELTCTVSATPTDCP